MRAPKVGSPAVTSGARVSGPVEAWVGGADDDDDDDDDDEREGRGRRMVSGPGQKRAIRGWRRRRSGEKPPQHGQIADVDNQGVVAGAALGGTVSVGKATGTSVVRSRCAASRSGARGPPSGSSSPPGEGTSHVVRSGLPSAEDLAQRPRADSSLPARGTFRIRVSIVGGGGGGGGGGAVAAVGAAACMKRDEEGGCVKAVVSREQLKLKSNAAGQRAAKRSNGMPANLKASRET
ncbi:hypothetical protein VTK26DRAFT_3913 [Humicola hyalothermophila]